jgi:hypothetical protein
LTGSAGVDDKECTDFEDIPGVPESEVRTSQLPPLQLQFSDFSVPSRIEPRFVHTTGGATISILGNFSTTEEAWCGFEGVRIRTKATRIAPLNIECQTPSRTVGGSRVYITARDVDGRPSVVSSSVGGLHIDFIEPLKLFEVTPDVVMDGTSVKLNVWGSNFRNVERLACRFESSQQEHRVTTHDFSSWPWKGRVTCLLNALSSAIKSFVMFSPWPLEPGEHGNYDTTGRTFLDEDGRIRSATTIEGGEPFVCVSLTADGWMYHSKQMRPFIP